MSFITLRSDFEERVAEVELFFSVLLSAENEELAVVPGFGPQVTPIGTLPEQWGRMLKGSGYLVLYNLVEAFVRRGFKEVFEQIAIEQLTGVDLCSDLRKQWIEQKNRKVKAFDGSPRVYMQIAEELVGEIVDKKSVYLHPDRLPFSGNLDADVIRDVCIRHGVRHQTPANTKGGSNLKTVMLKRNALAHGDESFSECGRVITANELTQVKDEVVLYLRAVIDNLEQFVNNKSYHFVPVASGSN